MSCIHKVGDIEYHILSQKDLEEVVPIVSHAFTNYEPMGIALKISYDEMTKYAEKICFRVAGDELSIVAKDERSNEIVGAMLVSEFRKRESTLDGPIECIMSQLQEKYIHRDINIKEYVHLQMLATANGYAKYGIAQQLIQQSLVYAKAKNYKNAIAELGGHKMQRLMKLKFGFEPQAEISYREFEYQGSFPFAQITDAESIVLMDKVL